jgi:hypothetical protein
MLQKRVEVFQDFMSSGKFKDLSLDGDKQDVLMKVRLLQSVLRIRDVYLGSWFFLSILDLGSQIHQHHQKRGGNRCFTFFVATNLKRCTIFLFEQGRYRKKCEPIESN